MSEPGGTLRDAIARAVSAFHFDGNEPLDRDDFPEADAVLVALKEHLAEHPEAIRELGFVQGIDTGGWFRSAQRAPASQDVGAE